MGFLLSLGGLLSTLQLLSFLRSDNLEIEIAPIHLQSVKRILLKCVDQVLAIFVSIFHMDKSGGLHGSLVVFCSCGR